MPLPKTQVYQAQDVVLSFTFPSATTGETQRKVSPISGRIINCSIARGGTHSAGNNIVLNTDSATGAVVNTMASGGAAFDVDEFNYGPDDLEVARGDEITCINAGSPTQTTEIAVFVHIRSE
jgi:plastocyanin